MNDSERAARQADPLIDEVRRVREQLSNEFGNDPRRLAEELRRLEREHVARGGRVVPAPQMPADRTKAG